MKKGNILPGCIYVTNFCKLKLLKENNGYSLEYKQNWGEIE